MKKCTRYAALLLGLTMTFSAVSVAMQPQITAYAAAWEKNASGTYIGSDGSTITGVLSRGIDVSHWKQTIDWKKVAADDVSFVMLGTRYNNEVDPYFGTNAINAHNAGLKVGAYIYSYATTVAMAEAEADFVLDLIKDYPISYPVVIDVESSEMSALSPTDLATVINAFCQKVELAGYYPMVYSNDYWLSNKIDMSKLHYDVWAARYDVKPTYTGAAMWQATNQGEVNGISGAVDINFTMKDFSAKLPADRWRLIDDQWFYYKNYVKQIGWINDGMSWYYLNTDGTQVKGWIKQDNDYYYLLPETGQMQTGWKQIDGSWYYLKSDGRMANEWLYADDKYYYLLNGAMVTGWLRIGTDYYYMKSDGSMATGWRKMDGNYYYFNTDGKLVRGWANLDGKYYYLKTDGTMVTGWQTIDNKTYYFNPSGDMA
ncbi:MAG: cell wall-binding protein, partial [Lachnospiraceae bacterium]|nr:cell wall-binding protein [Lachnospiraceae bacterium]